MTEKHKKKWEGGWLGRRKWNKKRRGGGRKMERGERAVKRSGLQINSNRRWARSHQQQVNLSKEQESLEEMKAKNPPYVSRCCRLMLFHPHSRGFSPHRQNVPGTHNSRINVHELYKYKSIRRNQTHSFLLSHVYRRRCPHLPGPAISSTWQAETGSSNDRKWLRWGGLFQTFLSS